MFDVFALLDKLNIARFKAIGVSGGAKTLLHMATRQPDRIDALALVSAAPFSGSFRTAGMVLSSEIWLKAS